MAFGIPSTMTTLAPYHIISYGTLLGTSLFQTFINTKICYLELPKSAFTTLQKRLFPIYFRCQALLLIMTILTFPPHGPASLFKVKSNWIPLMVAGVTSLANLLVYGPRSRQAMIDRTHQETRVAKRPGDVDEPSPDMLAAQSSQAQPGRNGQGLVEQETEAPTEVFIEDSSFTNSPVTSDGISNDGQLQPSQTQRNQRQHPCSVDLSLSYIVEVVHRPKDGSTEPVKVHYPIPACIADQSAYNHVPKVIETISLQEALTMPAPHIADQLIRPFFEIMHVAYPVFDRENFSRQYRQGQASPLVLQAMFLLGFTVCDDSLIEEAGFTDRATARRTHYLRAKALYDAEYESDHMNLVAVMLLLGFWWAGPEDQKDNCYWVNCAATMAQSLGMHRSHTSAAFGRPCRIRDEDCDIEPLTEEDFEFDKNGDERLIPAQHKYHVAYVMEMAKLTTILGDIIVAEFSPRRAMIEKYEAKALKKELRRWNSSLPAHLSPAPLDGSLGASFWASMVQFTYQYCHILLFRPKAIDNLTPAESERDKQARMAADAITRNAEDLLAAETIRSAQIHLVPTLFGALSIHTIVICRKDPIRRQLAENKSRQCLLALSQLSKSWPVRLWISKSFVSLMRRLTGQGSIVNVTSSIRASSNGSRSTAQTTEPSPRSTQAKKPIQLC
ncbi:hypothetical protein CSIM01_02441 [Colletotrichum simmondsii]|uniref:Transcription factor domain-containing protein n=1 Tax=Colletotrichum simmondsii TaxID=703756 RepID=A0A135S7L4_9PEZI|nr:hypothetical protein CSIM01_02441 [Colletotrichum simmondsii]